MSHINTILHIRDFFLILSFMSYFLFRITEIAILYIQALFLSLRYVFLRGWPHLSHLCVARKAPDREWCSLNTCGLKERMNIKL